MVPPDDADDGAGTVSVSVRLSSQPDRQLDRIKLARPSTVSDLKLHLAQTLEGKPKPEGIVCVLGGRVLRDGEVLGELAGRVGGSGENGGDDDVGDDNDISGALDLTLIVRPSAWTETPPSFPVKESAPPALAPPIPSTHAPSAASTQSPITTAAADLEHDVLPAELQPEASTSAEASEATAASSSGYTPAYVAAEAAPPAVAIPSATGSATNAQEPVTAPITPPSGGAPPVAANPYATYLAYLHRLVPIQRALLLLNLQKAHVWYATRSNGFDRVSSTTTTTTTPGERLEEVEAMLKEVGVWPLVEQSEIEAKKRWEEANRRRDEERRLAREFEVVRISGLPYLLHTPAALLARQPGGDSAQDAEAHVAVHRNRAIYYVLTTMLQLVLTLQPSAPAIAYGRGSSALGRTGGGGGLTGMRAAALDDRRVVLGPGAAAAPARRRATLSVIINLDAVLSLFVPLFLLSLKLAFLLWIFGRRASTSKRIALAIVAAIWVAYEGWAIQRRRAQATRERERAERERRRAARAAAAQAQRNEPPRQAGGDDFGAGAALPDRAQPAQQAAAQAPGQPAPNPGRRRPGRNHQHRVPASRLSPKYWLNLIAAVGLVSEARELGLSPRYIAGRPISPAAPPPRTAAERRREAIKRGLRNVAVAIVLFVGTLSPEVERKRKKAIEKRERLLAEKRVAAARQETLRIAAGRAAAPPSTPSSSTAPVASTSAVEAPPLRQRRTTITPSDSPFLSSQGRQRISDAELFQDGASEAYTRAAGESADPARLGDAALLSGSAPGDPTASLDSASAAAAPENAAEEQSPATPVVPSEDDDFAATSSASASASSSAGDSLGEEEDGGDEGGIARRVRARRARLLAQQQQQQQQQAQGGEGPPAADAPGRVQDGQDAVEHVVALF